jgi:NAD-dependent SIR2 family protein deacetylase
MSRNIVVLGAGASAADGAPIQADLFKSYFQYLRDNHLSIDQHHVKYFKTFWSIDVRRDQISDIVFPTFEEALGMLELARSRNEGFPGYYSTANQNTIEHSIEDLIFLIAEILRVKLQRKNVVHSHLIENIIQRNVNRDVTFISLNYDILVDNAITAQRESVDLDYGIEFLNYETLGNWSPPSMQKAISLFKVHGSLNWLYCPVCKQVLLTPKEKGVSSLIDEGDRRVHKCPKCGGRFVPILIPPTFFKVMSNSHLIRIWDLAEQALMRCNRIIFCGYSLPDADIHIKYLLKRGCLNRRGTPPDVFVINEHRDKSDDTRKEEKRRYQRLFGANVDYTTLSFEDFARDPAQLS